MFACVSEIILPSVELYCILADDPVTCVCDYTTVSADDNKLSYDWNLSFMELKNRKSQSGNAC